MEWAALIAWLATAGGGFVLLAVWLQRGGMGQREGGRLRPPLVLGHFGLAATGLVLWIVYVVRGGDTLPWIAFALVVAAAAIGWTMFFIWLGQRQGRAQAAEAGAPAEQHFPVPVVAFHGVAAVTTVVLVLLASLGVGTG